MLSGHSLELSAKYYFYDLVTHRETPEKDYTKTLISLNEKKIFMKQIIVYVAVLIGLLANLLVSFSQNMEVSVENNNPYPMSEVK